MQPKFKILDWAGNECISNELFETFDDDLGEYQVIEVKRGN